MVIAGHRQACVSYCILTLLTCKVGPKQSSREIELGLKHADQAEHLTFRANIHNAYCHPRSGLASAAVCHHHPNEGLHTGSWCILEAQRKPGHDSRSFAQALHMIKDIGAPNVVVHLDTYHMNIEEASMSKAIRNCQAAGRLGYAPLMPHQSSFHCWGWGEMAGCSWAPP